MIVAFAGQKGSGKDEAIRGILAAVPGAKRFAFAGRLKAIARELWDLTDAQTDGDEKETPLPHVVYMDSQLDGMQRLTGLPIAPRGLVATTPRQLLQYLGTEYVRSVDSEYWIRTLLEEIEDFQCGELVSMPLIADCRYPNEVQAVRNAGGRVVRVVRPGLPWGAHSDHPSETGIDALDVHAEIANTGTLDDLHRTAVDLVRAFQ